MAYCKINKSGCCERKGNLQIRVDFFLEEKDPRYQDTLVLVPDVTSNEYLLGYQGKVDKEGVLLKQADYDAWLASLPTVEQVNPFHSHFMYFDPDVTYEEIKAEMDFHLPNFYKVYQEEWDKVAGGMRHGFAVEKRLGCLDYSEVDTPENYLIRKAQVDERLSLLTDIQSKPASLESGQFYPATEIDVGAGAADYASYSAAGTHIDLTNPANDTGTLDTVEIWAFSNLTGTKVGVFTGSGADYTSGDYETIGAVTSGSKQTFTGLSIDVSSGNFIGEYHSGGYIDREGSGGSDVYNKSGDQFGAGTQTYTKGPDDRLALYATGETAAADITVTPTTLSLTIALYAPTVTKTDNKTATPTTLSLSITTYAPTVTKTENKTATPSTLSLTITSYEPSIITSGNKTVTPSTLELAITSYAPAITATDHKTVTPTTLALTITAYAPTIAGGIKVTPATLALAITGYAPTITIREIPSSAFKYILEVRNSSGTLVSILENAFDRTYTEKINEPQQLTFSIPAEDDKVSGLVKPNQVWLRDYSTGTLIRKFVITRLVKKDSGNCIYQVECKGYLSKLLKAVVQSYAPSGKTPTEILTALLAYQTLDTITLGTVDITGTYSFSWTNTTVLACLNDCLNVWGGYFDVDNDNELTWLDDIGSDVGQQIRYRKNLIDVEEETDYEGQNGRLYPSGSGSIVLSDKSVTMEEATMSEDATYGYLTVPTDYICFNESSLEVLRKGTKEDLAAFDVIANVSPGTDWDVVPSDSAYWLESTGKLRDGNDQSSRLGFRWNASRWFSGFNFQTTQFNAGTASQTKIRRIVIGYTPNAFTNIYTAWDSGVVYDLGDGTNTFTIDFGQRFYGNGLAITIYTYTPIGGTVADYIAVILGSAKGTIDLFDESESWTNINDRQLRIAIASYESGDTYYLSYDLADYLKDLTAISTYGDEGIQMQFSYAADVDTLLAYAIAQLEMINDPPKSYSGNILYLDEIDSNFEFEELDLGNIVDLIHEPLGIESSVRVVGMTQNLDNPSTGSIEIVRKSKTLTEAFKAIYGRL